jgi:hypothetical protein
MSIYIRLDKEINPQQLLQKLQHQINEHRKSNSLESSILSIDIKNTSHVVEDITRETIARLENNE